MVLYFQHCVDFLVSDGGMQYVLSLYLWYVCVCVNGLQRLSFCIIQFTGSDLNQGVALLRVFQSFQQMSKQCLTALTVIFLMKFLILYYITSAFGALLYKPQLTCSFQNMSWYWFELCATVCLYRGLISSVLLFNGMYVCMHAFMYVCMFNVR